MKMLYEINELISKGKELAMKQGLVFTGVTIFNGVTPQITYHLDQPTKGVELK
ncbi:MAG: hypothetical protein PQJ49_11190 [Sphaerochaetaceae bacterium]|nr:hypothetical protein [Sphaerochaetaceae bacterium]